MNQMTHLPFTDRFASLSGSEAAQPQLFELRVQAFRRLDEWLALNYELALDALEHFDVTAGLAALEAQVELAQRALDAFEAFEALRVGMLLDLERE